MAFTDEYDFDLLVNEAEKKIIAELEQQLNAYKGDICRCSECVIDMAAMALNAVRPLYRASLLGGLYAAQAINEESYTRSVQDAVARSIEKVRKNPAHD
ncbi:MAG: late competence development ComFB family protein [Treponema sp.]|jgi:competence protein ComFB|nr:late competence development ComFB family protein [Treponema sp.]